MIKEDSHCKVKFSPSIKIMKIKHCILMGIKNAKKIRNSTDFRAFITKLTRKQRNNIFPWELQ